MNETEHTHADSSELAELKEQVVQLERRTNLVQAALIVAALSVAFFVGVQVRRAGMDTEGIRTQLLQVQELNKKQDPVIQGLAQKLLEYGRAHPDFSPVVKKYGLDTNTALTSAPLLTK
jgi:hypothetical protein